MRVLIAPDKIKGSLGARAAAENIAAGMRAVLPEAEFILLPIADGGEGTAELIRDALQGDSRTCEVHDANGAAVSATFAMCGAIAVMETSQAIGLWRIPPAARSPTRASSFGAGEMLRHAAECGAREIIVGLGGSATNDGGFGLARALGFRFFGGDGKELAGAVPELLRLTRVEPPAGLVLPAIIAAVDVQNPLLGERGATRIFGTQKGASPEEIELLEAALTHLAEVSARDLGIDCRNLDGAGAAGGLGFGLATFAGARLRPGFEVVAEFLGLEKAVAMSDFVITGEGRLDLQTLEGKAPAGVARMARKIGRKCYAIVGQCEDAPELRQIFSGIAILGVEAEGDAMATARLLREHAGTLAAELR
ncbi:MAG: glycerate kinase [Chthoniobacterales bacterium]